MTEKAIHLGILQALKLLAAPGVLYWHTANNRMSARDGGYWKRLGVVAGVPDLQIIMPGKVGFLEIKTAKGRHSPEQKAMLAFLEASGCLVATVRSVTEAIDVLHSWGALKNVSVAA